MVFEHKYENKQYNRNKLFVGKVFGFLIGYVIFTSVLFFITWGLNKFPQTWSNLYEIEFIVIITAGVIFFGSLFGGNFTKNKYKSIPQNFSSRSFISLFVQGFKNGMDQFGKSISSFINTILLTIVYVFGVGITSLVAKITKKKFLNIEQTQQKSKKSKKETYWQDLNLTKQDLENYYRQF